MNRGNLKKVFISSVLILLGFIFGVGVSVLAWVNPSQSPPLGGGVLQTDTSGLKIVTTTQITTGNFTVNNGNVGIGTTGPWAMLEVHANDRGPWTEIMSGRMSGDSYPRFILKRGDSTTTPIFLGLGSGSVSPEEISFLLDKSSPFNPIRLRLHANSGSQTILELNAPWTDPKESTVSLTRNGAGYDEVVDLYNQSYPGAEQWGLNYIKNGINSQFRPFVISFQDGWAGAKNEVLRIDPTGNVGIGTTTPAEKLTVAGKIDVTGNRIVNLASPINSTDAATKGYVDAQAGGGAVLITYGHYCSVGNLATPPAAGQNAPLCPTGWTELYAGFSNVYMNGCAPAAGFRTVAAGTVGVEAGPFVSNPGGTNTYSYGPGQCSNTLGGSFAYGAITCRVCIK
jgi:hypothetical protein